MPVPEYRMFHNWNCDTCRTMNEHDWWLLAEWPCFALSNFACRSPLSCTWCMLLRGIQPARPAVPWVNSPFGEVYVVLPSMVRWQAVPPVLWLGCWTIDNSCSWQYSCHCLLHPPRDVHWGPCEAAVKIIAVLLATTGVGPQLSFNLSWSRLCGQILTGILNLRSYEVSKFPRSPWRYTESSKKSCYPQREYGCNVNHGPCL